MNVWEEAQLNLRKAAETMGLEPEITERLLTPMRFTEFTIPVRMDDGSKKIFIAYRSVHQDATGLTKDGTRMRPDLTPEEIKALSLFMSIKHGVAGIPAGGGKGGIKADPAKLSEGEYERLIRGFMRRLAPKGAFVDVPGADIGTGTQAMAWMLDHRKLRPSWLITLDADGQHMPEEVPLLLAEAKKCRNTLIIGSCPERSSWMRQMVWAFFRLISGLQVNDMTSGFKVYPVRAASVLCGPKTENLGYQDVPTLLFLSRRGFKICEIAVNMAPRRSGKSRVFSSWSKVTLYMFKVTRLCCFHRLAVLAKK